MPNTIELNPSFSGTVRGEMSVSLIHTRTRKPPDDDDFPPGAWEIWIWRWSLGEVARSVWDALFGRLADHALHAARVLERRDDDAIPNP